LETRAANAKRDQTSGRGEKKGNLLGRKTMVFLPLPQVGERTRETERILIVRITGGLPYAQMGRLKSTLLQRKNFDFYGGLKFLPPERKKEG